ncbi:MAG: hypothetical protein ATN35_09570 [Epulopiscium sp. Nele67-Bin004]|nr:MAG: hypothetical protein ATN35_09570 [Epulopiscium sp. Nele67-Bin004]
MQIQIQDTIFSFIVEYTKRKSFLLETTPEGHITLKAPKKSSQDEIISFMQSKSKELLTLQKRLDNRKTITHVKTYDDTTNFLLMGHPLTLPELFEVVPETPEQIQIELKKLYTTKTNQYIKEYLPHFEQLIGVKSKSYKIVDSPTTWGTCNHKQELTFNYKLSMCPKKVIDYVIIHEVCHILHLNHDRSFWRKVGMYSPDYKTAEAYLKKYGGVMTI